MPGAASQTRCPALLQGGAVDQYITIAPQPLLQPRWQLRNPHTTDYHRIPPEIFNGVF